MFEITTTSNNPASHTTGKCHDSVEPSTFALRGRVDFVDDAKSTLTPGNVAFEIDLDELTYSPHVTFPWRNVAV